MAWIEGLRTSARRVRRQSTVPTIELTALRIAVIYLLFGTSFLFLSDVVFVAYLSDPLLTQVQALKGGLEVALTTGLLFFLAQRSHRQLQRTHTQVRRKTKLINILSRVLRHNLRNSMTVIRGQIRTLDPQSPDTDDRNDLDAIIEATDDILELAEKTRQLEAVISADPDYHRADITSIIEHAVREVEAEYASPAVTVEHSNAVVIDVMPSLEKALQELIENAVKHTDDATTVTVSTERTHLQGTRVPDGVTITVADDGPGLPDSEQRVLERGSEDPLAHGSGLGLYMVYWIVTSHGGSISVSTDEDGTTIELTLPARQTQTVTDGASPQSRHERELDRFEAVFEESFDAMLIADDDGRYLNANEAAADLLGIPQEALLGRTITDFFAEEFDVETAWQEFQDSGEQRGTVPVVRADGERRLVEYAATPDVVPGQHLSVLRDITERREREHELSQFEQMLETLLSRMPVVLWTTDEDGVLTRARGAALADLGLEPGQAVGRSVSELYGDHPEIPSLNRRALDGEAVADTIEINEIEFDVWIQPLSSAVTDGRGTVGLACEVTDHGIGRGSPNGGED